MSEPKRRRRAQPVITEEENMPVQEPQRSEEAPAEPVVRRQAVRIQPEEETAAPERLSERAAQPAKKPGKRKKRGVNRTAAILAAVIAVLVLLVALCAYALFGDSLRYSSAKKRLAQGEYVKAMTLFEKLGSYEESGRYRAYIGAIQLAEQGQYSLAARSLTSMGDFMDSALLSVYYEGRQAEQDGRYTAAREIYQSIAAYADSAQRADDTYDAQLKASFDELAVRLAAQGWVDGIKADVLGEICPALVLMGAKYKSSDTRMFEEFYALGEKLLAEGNYQPSQMIFGGLRTYHYSDAALREQEVVFTWAMQDMENGETQEASRKLMRIREYPGAEEQLIECRYRIAGESLERGDVQQAHDMYAKLEDYKDAAQKAAQIEQAYADADALLSAGSWAAAREAFGALHDYSDSEEKVIAAWYGEADALQAEGKYSDARKLIWQSGTDMQTILGKVSKIYLCEAEALMAEGKYKEARDAFIDAGTDGQARIAETYYGEGEQLLSEEKWIEARQAFSLAGGYQDAYSRVYETYYGEAEALLAAGEWTGAAEAFRKAGTYGDAQRRILEPNLRRAEDAWAKGRYAEAIREFGYLYAEQAKGTELPVPVEEIDAAYFACSTEYARTLEQAGDYTGALRLYKGCGNEDGVTECRYQLALTDTNPVTAYPVFAELGDYKDSAQQAAARYAKRFAYIEQPDGNGMMRYSENPDHLWPLYGLLDADYHVVAEAQYSSISASGENTGVYIVQKDGLYGLIGNQGQVIAAPVYSDMRVGNSDGTCVLAQKDGLYGFIHADTGAEKTPFEWKNAFPFYEGYAYVMNQLDLWGVINEKGNVARKPEFTNNNFTFYPDCGAALYSWTLYDHQGSSLAKFDDTTEYLGDGVFRTKWGKQLYDMAAKSLYSYKVNNYEVMKLRKVGDGLLSCYYAVLVRSGLPPYGHSWYYGVVDVQKNKIISENGWDEEILYIPGPAKKGGLYGWIGADGYDLVKPEWNTMSEHLIEDCIIAGKYNAQGNLVYSVLSGSTGKVKKKGFADWESAEQYCRQISSSKSGAYDKAMTMMAQADYAGAIAELEPLAREKYMDAAQKLLEARYLYADALLAAGSEEEAIAAFAEMDGYSDTQERIKDIRYQQGKRAVQSGQWQAAVDAFTLAGDYSDAADCLKDAIYQHAETLFDAGSYDEAAQKYALVAGFRDADVRRKKAVFNNGLKLEEQGRYDEAAACFEETADVLNAQEHLAYCELSAISRKAVGDTVSFGRYPWKTAEEDTPIVWVILEKDGKKALLYTTSPVASKKWDDVPLSKGFDEFDVVTSWDQCTLRSWLNGEFLSDAFTGKEAAAIQTTTLKTEKAGEFLKKKPIVTTKDKVFLLDIEQATRHDVGQYSFSSWLRTQRGTLPYEASYIYGDETIVDSVFATWVKDVHPAVWVNTDPGSRPAVQYAK